MTEQQTYTSRSNAKRAAHADLGKDGVEGRDYAVTKRQDGRFAYQRVVSATKPDTGTKGGSGTRPPAKAKRPVSHRDRRDIYGLRLGSKRAQAAAMFERVFSALRRAANPILTTRSPVFDALRSGENGECRPRITLFGGVGHGPWPRHHVDVMCVSRSGRGGHLLN